ncbi:MAG: NAD(P)H-dependent glycerol-3-phosphate dehydrogenase [Patescibacteria group bacterium]
MKIGIIGAGAWGTALARLLTEKGNEVMLWFYDTDAYLEAKQKNINPFLPECNLNNIILTTELIKTVSSKDLLLLASPMQHSRSIIEKIKADIDPKTILVNCSKGIEATESFTLMSDIIKELLPEHLRNSCFLSGPSFAKEVAKREKTVVCIASANLEIAEKVKNIFTTDYFRPCISDDIIGVQIAGALKNIIAIAAGIIAGLGKGENTKAALVSMGLIEIVRFGIKFGGKLKTFYYPVGVGDLILTCNSIQSRNYKFGFKIGQGANPDDLIKAFSEVVEGYDTTKAVFKIAETENLNMPITAQLHQVLFKGKNPNKAICQLMA